MSNFHISPIQDTGGNINFIPSTSNNTDKSLLSIYWTDIIDKPNFSNISTTGIYNDLNKNKPWIYSSSNSYNSPITSFIGIGTNNPNFSLDINGSINLTGILNKNKSPYQNSQWVSIIENSSSNIYFNDGSIGIGSSTFTSNFNLNGNIRTAGNIYPDTNGTYNLGSSDFKWRHLYLSSNSIYLDNISISKTTDNYISIPSVNLNDITISSNFNGNNKTGNLRLNQSSIVVIDDSNNLNKYPVLFDNPYDYSNIILSNVLSNSSNNIYNKLKSLNTDTIPIPNDTNKRFIVNDAYNRDITFTGILTTSNLITSNINVIGDTTTLNTTLYITEQLQVENNTNATAMIVKQVNATKNLFECYNQSSLSFIINSNGNIGIGGGANNTYKLNINGSLNTSDELYIKGTNISNIIDLKVSNTSNTLINYNNLINRPLLSSVALNGIYGSLIGTPFIASGNNYYTSLSGNLGIGTSIINNKLEVLGGINVDGASGEILIKGTNISNIIDLKVSNTSNILINYNNVINRPSFATVATSGNYNDLSGKPVYISDYKQMSNIPFGFNTGNNNLIYNTNSGNFGIKTANPNYKFQVNGDLNYTSSLRISNVLLPFSYYSNTNITSSNGIFSYISNNNSFGYYTFLTSGSITFPQATNCDLLVVGAGGNGGTGAGGGGGGAGEVIYYPNYSFSAGTSNITIGYSDSNINNRISRILSGTSNLFTGNGSITINNYGLVTYNYNTQILLSSGTYNITFNNGSITIGTLTSDKSYPILKDTFGNNINPIISYQFDNDINNILIDNSGNGYTLTNNNVSFNNTNFIKGNGSASFSGNNNRLIINGLNINNKSFSISLWSYLTDNTKICGLFSLKSSSGTTRSSIHIQYVPPIYGIGIYFNLFGDDLAYTGITTTTETNIWHHYVFVLNNDTNPKTTTIYRDGINVATKNLGGGYSDNINIYTIGQVFDDAAKSWAGQIDDFRIYNNIALNLSQVNELYKGRVEITNYNSQVTALGGGDGGGIIIGAPTYSTSGTGTVSGLTSVFGSSETYLSFTSGTITLTLNSSIVCDILVVAGGGGGAGRHAGGGGAGALIYETNKTLNSGTYTISIGAGGNKSGTNVGDYGQNGGDSSIVLSGTTIYLAKGGGGARFGNGGGGNGANGGSGGGGTGQQGTSGGSAVNTNIPSGTYGNNGGAGSGNGNGVWQRSWSGGGGGGAQTAGSSSTLDVNNNATPGNGGNGRLISITGINTYYAGGGGGGVSSYSSASGALGGLGGGGDGGKGANAGLDGVANTGGGGGGGGWQPDPTDISGAGGNGGSGIVIIRFNGFIRNALSGGSGGGGRNSQNGSAAENKWNATYSYSTAGANGTASVGGNGGYALSNIIQLFQANSSINITSNVVAIYNYTNINTLISGTYSINFNQGGITFTGIATDKSYPIIKDISGNNINPLIWYKFDTTGLLLDSGTSINNLTNFSATSDTVNFIKGDSSISVGNGKYVSITNDIPFRTIQTTNGITISLWFRGTSSSGNYAAIFHSGLSYVNDNTNVFKIIKDGSFTNLQFYYPRIGNNFTTSGTNYFTGAWYHIVWTISNTGISTIYINGVNINSTLSTANFNGGTNDYNSNKNLGRGSASGEFLDGNIDDFRIYNITLSGTQVNELYNGRVEIYNTGFTESITGSSLVVGVGGSGASSSSLPVLKTTYGSGGDGNGGLGTQGIVIIKVPLNISSLKYDGNFEYSNVFNRPLINDVFTNSNLINLTINNQINFPLGDVSWANEWFLYMGMSPTNISNSFIFWHLNSNARVNSKWWFNGTTANTNNEISDIRVKKEIIDIINPLSNLMLIKPKEYYLCDEKDYLKKYGIIAQDIKEVLPEFVYTDTDYIANIYSPCSYLEVNNNYFLNINDNNNFTFNSSNIQVGDELKLLLNNNDNNKEIIIEDLPYHNRYKRRFAVVREIIDEKTIEINQKLELEESEKTNLFIYGKKVNDFLKLDYSSLYTLNIKCNQELYKTYLEQQEKLISLNQRLINLENFN